MENRIKKVVETIKNAKHCVIFTGAGVSVESGIPPFRGEGGIYNDLDTNDLRLSTYISKPIKSWKTIKQMLFKAGHDYKHNKAHEVIAKLEEAGYCKAVITQNIDNLHQEAGTKTIYELHGNGKTFVCTKCGHHDNFQEVDIDVDFPTCSKCDYLTKPNFTFFEEGLPTDQYEGAIEHIRKCDLIILVGTSGEVFPAANMPLHAKKNGATVIEINPDITFFTPKIVDIIINGKASVVFSLLEKEMF